MCLIFINPSPKTVKPFSKEWFTDFYQNNPDGMGAMYGTTIDKFVPKNLKEAYEFYLHHASLATHSPAFAVHLRMKTHGDINKENSHPYQVTKDKSIWLMHNGVLRNTPSYNKAMSDTWHYVQETLTPLLQKTPSLLNNQAFISLLEDHITSSNKFVFLSKKTQKLTIVNESEFVMHLGHKLSNTYAWSSDLIDQEYPYPYPSPYVESDNELAYMTKLELEDWVYQNPTEAAEYLYDLLGNNHYDFT